MGPKRPNRGARVRWGDGVMKQVRHNLVASMTKEEGVRGALPCTGRLDAHQRSFAQTKVMSGPMEKGEDGQKGGR